MRTASSFCTGCGGPTAYATHDERVQYEVRQWRASRASDEQNQPMMLVRTEAGYQPMPVAQYNQYVWDQPLHPEREVAPAPPEHANGNGNGHGYANGSGHTPVASSLHVPEPEPVQRSDAPPVDPGLAAPAEPPAAASAPATLEDVRGPLLGGDERVTISKKAVAIGLAIVLGLPLAGKLVGVVGGSSKAPAVAPGRAAALITARHGFVAAGPDAVRYAVVLKNPNPSFQASAVTVNVALHDARGRLVGRTTEGVTVVPAGGVTGIAGTVGVSAPASRLTVTVGAATFQETTLAKPFSVRNVRMSRSGASLIVQAVVSGVEAVTGARVVAVHLDRAGRVLGGDFAFVDVPRAPKAATATISTAGVPRAVARVEVYVLR